MYHILSNILFFAVNLISLSLFISIVWNDAIIFVFSISSSDYRSYSKPRTLPNITILLWYNFIISNIHWYLPSFAFIFVACLPVFCSRQLSQVLRKRIYRNVIFRPLKTDLHALDSPRPRTSISLVIYVTTSIFYYLSMCKYVSHVIIFYFYITIHVLQRQYPIIL